MTVELRDIESLGAEERNGKYYEKITGTLYGKGTIEEALANATYKVNGVDVPQFHDNGMFENKILAMGTCYVDNKTFKITLYNNDNTWGNGIAGR